MVPPGDQRDPATAERNPRAGRCRRLGAIGTTKKETAMHIKTLSVASIAFCLVASSGQAAPTPINPGDPVFPAFVQQPMTAVNPMNPNRERSGLATKPGALLPIWDHDLANMVRPLAGAGVQLNFAFGQCFGGGMIDDMLGVAGDALRPGVGGNNLTATSASRWDEFSWYRRPVAMGGVNRDWVDTHNNAMLPVAPSFERMAYNAFRNDPWGTSLVAPRGNEGRFETAQWGQRGAASGANNLTTRNNRYAVLYSGDPNAIDWEQLGTAYTRLTVNYGYNPADIFLVADAGFASIPAGNPLRNAMTGIPAANGIPATLGDLNNLFALTLNNLNANDQLYFLANDHGVLQTQQMQPGCWMRVPKRPGEGSPGQWPSELPPAPSSPGSQYLGSITEMFDIDPLTGSWTVKPSYEQYYVPTPGSMTLAGLGLLALSRRRGKR
jgi:hypothetical protein